MNIGVQMNNAYYISGKLHGNQAAFNRNGLQDKSVNAVNLSEKVKTYKESDALRGLENGREQAESVRRFRDSYDNIVQISAASTKNGIKAVETSMLSDEDVIRSSSQSYVAENTPEIMISISSAGRAALQTIEALNKASEERESENAQEEIITSADDSNDNTEYYRELLNNPVKSSDINNEKLQTVSSKLSESGVTETKNIPGTSTGSEKKQTNENTRSHGLGRISGRANYAYNFQMKYRQISDNLR